MINDLTVATSANFYVIRKKISDSAIEKLFTSLRNNHGVTKNNEFKHTRQQHNGVRWSAVCFKFESKPSFLKDASTIRETLCGFLLLIEYEGYAAILSSRLSLPSSFKSEYLSMVATARVEGAVAKADAVFQRITMRNMSISPHALRTKTLEASDLANVVGPAGSRRYAPRTYSVTADKKQSTATPSTGRIGIRSDRADLPSAVTFAKDIIEALRVDNTNVSPFIRSFARPISLAEALAKSTPIALAFDTNQMFDAVDRETDGIRLFRLDQGTAVKLSDDELNMLMEQLNRPLDIAGNERVRLARCTDTAVQAASISLNKNRIALRSLSLSPASDVFVENASGKLGENEDRQTLREYLDEINALIVLFDDVGLAYIDGQMFRDETLLDGGESFLRYFVASQSLANVTSEKGVFTHAQTNFDSTSSFGAIVDHIAVADTILLCDDLGNEWADFIGVTDNEDLTQISFYHAKHGVTSLGASPFHVSVSQAIKNLGNMTFPEDRLSAKLHFWSQTYNAPEQETQIKRTVRSSVDELASALRRARTAPDMRRRAVIVTSSLSLQAVTAEFAAIQQGKKPTPSFVQLYWLLQSFFSACTEVGASGSVVCQP